jgi:lysophospholipase L1-like esterase
MTRATRGIAKRWLAAVLLAAVPLGATAARAENKLQPNDFVAICGDSITEQKMYSVYVENYLLMCKPQPDLRAMQFGWSGEVAPGFLNKMPTQALRFPMTVATTAYGMNDGQYSPMTPEKAKRYRDAMQGIVDKFKEHKVRFIVVGSPGCVDTDTFLRDKPDPNDPEPDPKKKKKVKVNESAMYNKTLGELRDIAREVAEKNNCAFADVYQAMYDAMVKAKAKYGPTYNVPGGDGFHPGPNGQLCMAYAFLKGLGVDGHIGTITLDLAANKAEATDGHKVVGVDGGEVTVESTRYPFCFYGDPTKPNSTSGIIEFLPFNQDLNRYMLVVKNAGAGKVKVTWGLDSKEFPAADLAKGINLAAEFVKENPFKDPFKQVENLVKAQQNAETPLVKKTLNNLPKAADKDAAEKAAQEEMAAAKSLFDKAAEAAKKPVRHTVKVEAVK